jgi:hypothetical protein
LDDLLLLDIDAQIETSRRELNYLTNKRIEIGKANLGTKKRWLIEAGLVAYYDPISQYNTVRGLLAAGYCQCRALTNDQAFDNNPSETLFVWLTVEAASEMAALNVAYGQLRLLGADPHESQYDDGQVWDFSAALPEESGDLASFYEGTELISDELALARLDQWQKAKPRY